MDWLTAVEIAGMVATLIFIGFLIKEFKKISKRVKKAK